MRRTRSMFIAACATLALIAATATAQVPADRRTLVTFSGPVSIPGATLPAGTFTFKIADSPANRHIVQIFDKDESKIFATVLAVAAERAEAGGDPVITFKETPSDRPPAVHFWYYAGEKSGNEMVYPKDQALAIARASGEPVMAIDCTSADMKDCKGDVSRVSAADATSAAASTSTASTASTTTSTSTATSTATTTTAPEPARPSTATSATTTTTQPPVTTQPTTTQPTTQPEPTTPPPAVTTPAPTTQPSTAAPVQPEPAPVGTSGREELPRTASQLPLVGLIGLFSLAGALALRVARA